MFQDCSPSYLDLKDQIVEKRGVLRAGETNRGKAAKKEFKAKEKDRFQKVCIINISLATFLRTTPKIKFS